METSKMKKLINKGEDVVEEMIQGVVSSFPNLRRLGTLNVILRADALDEERKNTRVSLISGGGSGHEPAHAGYIGKGMLTAAVLGNVFTSPTTADILSTIRAITGPKGTLLIVKNYTGDRLNFGIAAEIARSEGYKVQMIIVGDDCALLESTTDNAGRRGIAGTVLVHKIAGAVAESGASLEEVVSAAQLAAESVFTMGIGLSPCTIPSVGKPTFTLGEDEVELGLGIHGEAGLLRQKLQTADTHVDQLLKSILPPFEKSKYKSNKIVVLVNNLGSTTNMELSIISRRAIRALKERGYDIQRFYCGAFMTALEMSGVSLSVMGITSDDTLKHLDMKTEAPAWPNTLPLPPNTTELSLNPPSLSTEEVTTQQEVKETELSKRLFSVITKCSQALLSSAELLTKLDAQVGDGDMGINLEKAINAILPTLNKLPLHDPSAAFHSLALSIQKHLGGTSGPLYTVFFLRFSSSLKTTGHSNPNDWIEAMNAGIQGISSLGDAKEGDRTMLDALIPAYRALKSAIDSGKSTAEALRIAAKETEQAAQQTAQMVARRGRSSYLLERVRGHIDPGAKAIAILMSALADEFKDAK